MKEVKVLFHQYKVIGERLFPPLQVIYDEKSVYVIYGTVLIGEQPSED